MTPASLSRSYAVTSVRAAHVVPGFSHVGGSLGVISLIQRAPEAELLAGAARAGRQRCALRSKHACQARFTLPRGTGLAMGSLWMNQ